jgi:hypothetical protein
MKRNREYFSWSQYSLWNKSKKEFYKRYGLGEESKTNRYFEKGKELGIYLETGYIAPTADETMLKLVGDLVPKLDLMEEKIEVEFDGCRLLSYIDSSSIDREEFYEYKTGKVAWTQELVDAHEQLDFYAVCYYILNQQTFIPKCKLVWIETEESEDNEIAYTGRVEIFERSFTEQGIADFFGKILTTIQEIEEWEYVEMEIDDELVDRYIEVQRLLTELKEESDTIKLEIQVRMQVEGVQYATGTNGKFSLSKRKSWSYSDGLEKFAAEIAAEIKKAQAAEQKSGEAKFTETESLRFSIVK